MIKAHWKKGQEGGGEEESRAEIFSLLFRSIDYVIMFCF